MLNDENYLQKLFIDQAKPALERHSGGDGVVNIIDSESPDKSMLGSFTTLGKVRLPNATSIADRTFRDCTALTSVDLPNVTSIGSYAFHNCTALTSVDLPNVTSIGDGVFYGCTALTSIDLPNVTSIGTYAFRDCTTLTSIDLPNVTSIGDGVFYGCTALTSIDLPNATSIGNGTFYGCAAFSTLIVRTTSEMCSINLTSLLTTKILSAEGAPTGEGFVYVPAALYDEYFANFVMQAGVLGADEATAQVMVGMVLRKIEDYPEICEA